MGLLTVCAQHYEGLFWLVSFYLLLNSMPHLYRIINQNKENHKAFVEGTALRYSPLQQALFFTFMCSLVYVDGSLPCGRFYYEAVEGFFGNTALRASYQYLYLYLGFLAHAADRAERWLCAFPRHQGQAIAVLESTKAYKRRKPSASWSRIVLGHEADALPR